jgi:hypothetical protein
LVAAGVVPINEMRDGQVNSIMKLICQRVPKEILDTMYGVNLKKVSPDESNFCGYVIDNIPVAFKLKRTSFNP